MSDKKSGQSYEEFSVPEIWSNLKERLEPTQSRSRYQVSDDGGLSEKAIENLLDAHDLALNRPVSLKQLRRDDISDDAELEAFVSEARLTGNLQHPNIIPVHDLVPDDNGALYFTLRHVDGKKLSALLKDGKGMSLNDVITIFTKVCDAISYAHDKGVFHTALSANTIMIGNYGEVFVLNWGNAVTRAGGRNRLFEDVRALGQILQATVHRAVGPSEKVPLSLDAVIRRATSPHGKNYSSVQALRADIVRYLSGLPTEAEEASFIRQTVLLARRHKLETATMLVAALIAFLMTAGFIRGIGIEKERAVAAATAADRARKAVEKNTKEELKHLEELQRLVPMLVEQVDIDMANGRPKGALERTEIALELTRDNPTPTILELHGDILQLLRHFEDSIASYSKIPAGDDHYNRAQKKIQLSRKCLKMNSTGQAGDNVLGWMYLEMVATNRMHEANYILNNLQKRQLTALKKMRSGNTQVVGEENFSAKLDGGVSIRGSIKAGEMHVIWNCMDNGVTSFDAIRSLPFTALASRSGKGIANLDALRGKPLMILNLTESKISTVSALEGLPLKFLRMDSSEVTSLDPLRGLPLETLILRNSPYTTLAPLSDLRLKTLDISGSMVQTLAPLSYQKLEKFSCADTNVTSLSNMDLSSMKDLNIDQTEIASLDDLESGALVRLSARGTQLSDITPLTGNPLSYVDLTKTKVRDLEPLNACPLTSLVIASTNVSSLNPIASAETLKRLDISGLSIRELPDNNWNDLTTLLANETQITDLRPLAGKPLRVIELAGAPVTDISPIIHTSLYRLELPRTAMSDLSPLAGSNVKHLNIAGTKVNDLRPLETVFLSSLNISNTPVSSLSGLEKQPMLELDIRGSRVTDLTPLKGSILKTIRLDKEMLASLRGVINDLPFLETIVLENMTYTPKSLPGNKAD